MLFPRYQKWINLCAIFLLIVSIVFIFCAIILMKFYQVSINFTNTFKADFVNKNLYELIFLLRNFLVLWKLAEWKFPEWRFQELLIREKTPRIVNKSFSASFQFLGVFNFYAVFWECSILQIFILGIFILRVFIAPIFWQKKVGLKATLKMFMKLTNLSLYM